LQAQYRLLNELIDTAVPAYRSSHVIDLVIRTQAAAAMRNLRPLHFWRYKIEESDYNETYRETSEEGRKYSDPIPIYMYAANGPIKSELTKPAVTEDNALDLTIDLAECIRLGEIFDTDDINLDFKFYLPIEGDVFQWDKTLYEISGVNAKRFYEPVRRFIKWKAQAGVFNRDSTAPVPSIEVLPEDPPLEQPVWLK